MVKVSCWLVAVVLLWGACGLSSVWASSKKVSNKLTYSLEYTLELMPEQQGARVTMSIDKGEMIQRLSFNNQNGLYSKLNANGTFTQKDGVVYWDLPRGRAKLSYFVKITHERNPGKFDALINADWALFRGDDIIPPVHTYESSNEAVYESRATLAVVLPDEWTAVETGWPRKKGNVFLINNPERRFDRPTGWMIAGKIGTRRDKIGSTSIAVTGPKGEQFKRMDALIFMGFVWPQVESAFKNTPDKLLIVGSGDPMWRGGLSAANSLFLHADRPLASENGTSPLLHELTHMVTRISGQAHPGGSDDWIAEGIAEFYSFELLYRAKGISKSRRNTIIAAQRRWGADIEHLRVIKSTGPVTARAVILLDELDKEIRQRSYGKFSLDNVVRELMLKRKVSLDDLRSASESLVDGKLKTLNSSLLK